MKRNGNLVLAVIAAILGVLVLAAAVGLLWLRRADSPQPVPTQTPAPAQETEPVAVSGVQELRFEKQSSKALLLSWTAPDAEATEEYRVMRRPASEGDWKQIGAVGGSDLSYTDTLSSDAPQQYLYRVDRVPARGGDAVKGAVIPASNMTVCIDPGHYLHSSELTGDALYGYGEGLFTLRLGLALREELQSGYGISVVMTRTTDSITLDGYTDGELDNHHLSLRGSYAAGSDLFLSLHTNANQDNVNDSPTCNQPIGINKTIVFVNRVALASETAMAQANAIGARVTAVNDACGLSTTGRFEPGVPDALRTWSDDYNDSLDTPGTVCYRDGENHQDYYGVLRGAASVNVPGLIVEHGFHTVAEVRQAAMEGDLAQRWAEADAAGIAEGWGFVKISV